MFSINNREISISRSPYIIAELSANHNGSIEKAKETIKSAKECGADAVKLQTYTADSMTINCDKKDFKITDGLWKGYQLYSLYQIASTPYEWHKELFDYAIQIGITIFSTPFDEHAVDFLDDLGTPAYKIASFELTDLALIKYVASKGKPMLMSTGMGSFEEIRDAVEAARSEGAKDLLLFHCISSYPAPTEESNIRMIKSLRKKFDLEVGLSDHTLDNTASLAAVSLGASAIEKHFTISRNNKGPDSEFSIEPSELKELKEITNSCWLALGKDDFSRSSLEIKNKMFRRSLYYVEEIKAGEQITTKNIRKIRPGFGLPPKYFDQILNKKVKRDITKGERVSWDDFE